MLNRWTVTFAAACFVVAGAACTTDGPRDASPLMQQILRISPKATDIHYDYGGFLGASEVGVHWKTPDGKTCDVPLQGGGGASDDMTMSAQPACL